jgi:hypothetical protein
MIGRFSVVSRPTSSSKKSTRWLIWKPDPRPAAAIADPPGAGDHLTGDEPPRDHMKQV